MIECSNSKWQMATISLSWFKAQDKCALQTNIQLSRGVGLSPSSGVPFLHLRMINWVCHMKGRGLIQLEERWVVITLRRKEREPIASRWKVRWKRWRKRSEGTLLNKVTGRKKWPETDRREIWGRRVRFIKKIQGYVWSALLGALLAGS